MRILVVLLSLIVFGCDVSKTSSVSQDTGAKEQVSCDVENLSVDKIDELGKYALMNGKYVERSNVDYRPFTGFQAKYKNYSIRKSDITYVFGAFGVYFVTIEVDAAKSDCKRITGWLYDSKDKVYKAMFYDADVGMGDVFLNYADRNNVVFDRMDYDYGMRYGRVQYIIDADLSKAAKIYKIDDMPIRFLNGQGDKVLFESGNYTVEATLSDDVFLEKFKIVRVDTPQKAILSKGKMSRIVYTSDDGRHTFGIKIKDTHNLPDFPPTIIAFDDNGETEYALPMPPPDVQKSIFPTWEKYYLQDIEFFESGFGGLYVYGGKLWFGTSFYNGEGSRGISTIGNFDLETRQYDIWYDKVFSPYSVSGLFVDDKEMWATLSVHPEGGSYSAGVFKLNYKQRGVKMFTPHYDVSTISRYGDIMFFVAEDGAYALKNNKLYRMLIVKNIAGDYEMKVYEVTGKKGIGNVENN